MIPMEKRTRRIKKKTTKARPSTTSPAARPAQPIARLSELTAEAIARQHSQLRARLADLAVAFEELVAEDLAVRRNVDEDAVLLSKWLRALVIADARKEVSTFVKPEGLTEYIKRHREQGSATWTANERPEASIFLRSAVRRRLEAHRSDESLRYRAFAVAEELAELVTGLILEVPDLCWGVLKDVPPEADRLSARTTATAAIKKLLENAGSADEDAESDVDLDALAQNIVRACVRALGSPENKVKNVFEADRKRRAKVKRG